MNEGSEKRCRNEGNSVRGGVLFADMVVNRLRFEHV